MKLFVRPDGTIQSIYQEEVNLDALGPFQISRASHVEPGEKGDWEVRMLDGVVYKGFRLRSEALSFEVLKVEERMMMDG